MSPRTRVCGLAGALVLLGTACSGPIDYYTREKLELPPAPPTGLTRPYADRTCEELYAEIHRLQPRTLSTEPDFLEDPRNIAAASIGLMFHPAFAVWGYTAATGYLAEREAAVAAEEIDRLRVENAYKDCWVR